MAISTRWSPKPVMHPAHSPSIMPRPSSRRPSSAKKSIATSRDSTTMPTLSIRFTAISSPLPSYPLLRECFLDNRHCFGHGDSEDTRFAALERIAPTHIALLERRLPRGVPDMDFDALRYRRLGERHVRDLLR